jgi:hypothetical protein
LPWVQKEKVKEREPELMMAHMFAGKQSKLKEKAKMPWE